MTLIKALPDLNTFSDLFDDNWLKDRFSGARWAPAVNVVDNKKNYEIELAVPGMKKEDFHVTLENGILTVEGQSEKEKEEKERNYTRKEFSSRSFLRSFTLPQDVSEEVEARYKDGVLLLNLKKLKEAHPAAKEVEIK